jgi:DNA-binding NarL/FixJ family response regulator
VGGVEVYSSQGRNKMSKLLVVEDNPIFKQTLVESLVQSFPEVQIMGAGDGTEALRLVEEDHPVLVIMDIKLPGDSGLDLTRKIKKDHPEISVVILTSYDLQEYREAAQRFGASHFLCKGSTTMQEILDMVRSILSESTSQNAAG